MPSLVNVSVVVVLLVCLLPQSTAHPKCVSYHHLVISEKGSLCIVLSMDASKFQQPYNI